MRKSRRASITTIVAAVAIVACPAASFAQVNVIISGGFALAYEKLLPEFEKSSGITITTARGGSQGDGPNTIGAQLRRGLPVDVVIMNRAGLNDLIAEGRIVAGTDRDLAQTFLGLAVRAGAAKPDMHNVEAFKQTLLHARSVALDSSTTGIYMTTKLYPQLGIADEMARKTTMSGPTAVANGEAEINIQPISEQLPVKGIELLGKIPEEVQYAAVFSAALVSGSKEADAARRLIAFLTSESAKAAIRSSGMDPCLCVPMGQVPSTPR
jgi:molybdate transport system substrate-binding protein